MTILLIIGIVLAVGGLAGLGYCIFAALRLRKADWPEDKMRKTMMQLSAINLGSLGLSAFGLALVFVAYLLD